jgi:DNA polymerase elongation subunit (family B)
MFIYSIEPVPGEGNLFPKSDNLEDIISQICVIDDSGKFILTSRKCDKIEGVTIIEGENEKNLLENFILLMSKCNPNVIGGWNMGFDDEYLWKRIQINSVDMSILCKDIEKPYLTDDGIYYPGKISLDILSYIRKNIQLRSYNLDYVAKTLLNKKLEFIKIEDKFKKLKGTPCEMAQCANESLRDCEIVLKLKPFRKYESEPESKFKREL